MSAYGVALFNTTTSVMRAEKLLQKAGITVKLIPTPRQFSSDCGIAVRFDAKDLERARGVFAQARLEPAAIHEMQAHVA